MEHSLNSIPKDVLIMIALNLDLYELLLLCKTNKTINSKICNNKYFWLKKLLRDFNFRYDDYRSDEDPRLAYNLLYKIENDDYNMHLKIVDQPSYQAAKTGSKSLFLLVLKKIQQKNTKHSFTTKHELYLRNITYGLEGSIESMNLNLIKFFVEDMGEKISKSQLNRAIEINNHEIIEYLKGKYRPENDKHDEVLELLGLSKN